MSIIRSIHGQYLRFAFWSTTTFEWLILRKKGSRDQLAIEVVFGFYCFWSIQIHWNDFCSGKKTCEMCGPPGWTLAQMTWETHVEVMAAAIDPQLLVEAWKDGLPDCNFKKQDETKPTCKQDFWKHACRCTFDVYIAAFLLYIGMICQENCVTLARREEDFIRVPEDIKDVTPTVREDMLKQHAALVRLILASNRVCTWFQVIIRLKILCCGSGPSMYLNQQAVYGQLMKLKQHWYFCSPQMASRQSSWCEALMILSTVSFEISCFDMTSSGNIAGRHGSRSQPSLCSERYGFLMSNFLIMLPFMPCLDIH